MQWILALPAPKEGSSSNVQKPKIGDTTNRKSLSEYDLQSSGNEIGTGNTETSSGMKTSVNIENIPEFSPYFQSEYGMIRDNLEENADEIAIEKIKSKRNSSLEKPKPQGDNEEKIHVEVGCHEKIKSKRRRRSKKHEPLGDKEDNIDHKSSCVGFDTGFGEDKLPAREKLKSKEKKKVVEDKILENDDVETCKFKHKKCEPQGDTQGDNGEKIGPELCCYGSAGKGDQTAVEKIKSKKKRRSMKCEAQVENKEKFDPKPCCDGYDIGFGKDKLPARRKLKFKEKKKVVEDKIVENDDSGTSKFKHKKREPQGDNGEKTDPELCCYGSAGKGDQTAVEKIKYKKKRRSMKCEAQVENKEKIDPKPSCDGYDIGFVENMQLENGKIKSMEKKAVEDDLQETVDGTKTSKFKLKKTEPEVQKNTVQVGVRYVSPFHNDSSKKILAKPLDNGINPEPFAFPISKDLMGDKVVEDGSRVEINQQGQEGCLFSVVLTSAANGNGFESISIKLKKKTVESAMVGKACHCSQIDNVEKSVEVEALEHGQGLKGNENGNDIETIKVKFKKRKSNDEKTARSMNDKVRKVCPSSQNDNEKRVNVKAVHDENDFDSGAKEG